MCAACLAGWMELAVPNRGVVGVQAEGWGRAQSGSLPDLDGGCGSRTLWGSPWEPYWFSSPPRGPGSRMRIWVGRAGGGVCDPGRVLGRVGRSRGPRGVPGRGTEG